MNLNRKVFLEKAAAALAARAPSIRRQNMTRQAEVAFTKWGPVPLRLMVGLVFLMHGSQKLITFGIPGVTGMMTSMGIPFPAVSAIVVTAVEVLGGLSLIFGLLSRWAAVALATDMAVAVFAVRVKGGFFAPNGAEFELTLLAACLTLCAIGSGALSLDSFVRRGRN